MNTIFDYSSHNFADVFGDPIVMVHLSQYISTIEFLEILQAYKGCRHIFETQWGVFRNAVTVPPKSVVISNTSVRDAFFHFVAHSVAQMDSILVEIARSSIIIENIILPVESMPNYEQFTVFLNKAGACANLSDEIIMCQFRFSPVPSKDGDDSGIQYSSTTAIPGGTIRLFKRAVSSLYPGNTTDQPASVAGIDMDTTQVWLCRVFSISDMRLDLKAGSTRSDVLRVPNGSKMGTWTDLCPVSEHSPIENPSNIYVVEYMKSFSIK